MQTAKLKLFVTCGLLFSTLMSSARTSENFNSRKGIPLHQLRNNLQNNCWTFLHFDVNYNGWNPKIEGDGAMVADAKALPSGNSGIYTPFLSVSSEIEVSFEYTFSENFHSSSSRWLKLGLADGTNKIVHLLELIEFNGFEAIKRKKYNTKFTNLNAGEYRLVFLYGGNGGSANIAIDELQTSAPLKYPEGCNAPPDAGQDKITGMYNRTASGSVMNNDQDKNREALKAYLIKGSTDGTVQLAADGTFVFTPNEGFRGSSTSFEYNICDEGSISLCSANTTVRINFPSAPESQLVDFKGSYKYDGNVELAWATNPGTSLERFEIERSLDGRSWEKSGIIPANNTATTSHDYTYIDKVQRNKALKKDLYYRLKQVNADGSIATSKLLVLRVYNTKTLKMISVTPDPDKRDIAVNIQLHENALVSVRVLNNEGNAVLRSVKNVDQGVHNLLVDGSSQLKPGMYLLELIVNSNERMLVKLIKE